MRKFKNPFAINENKEVIYIKNGDIENKDKYKKCYCPTCGEKLLPRMGEKNTWHFSHSNNKECNGNFETSLHMYAKEVIRKNNKILLPEIRIFEYIDFNKMDSAFIQDLHKWEYENQERISSQIFINENVYTYKWIENEMKVNNFVPDCIVEIGGKKLAIEIFVTHAVDKDKEKKVKQSKIDMIEIDLNDIAEKMQDKEFDLERYILFDSLKWWIYKTRVKSEEEKLYNKIYNTKHYIANEKHTTKELFEKRIIENRKKEYEEKIKKYQEQRKEERRKYAIEHKEEYEKSKLKKIIRIIENYSLKKQKDDIHICNIPVKGEYAFDCTREVWQEKIYNKFILNREGKNIQLAKIISWIEKYSGIKYFKEFDYSKDAIWDSKYDAVRNYLLELEKLEIIKVLDYNINKWGEIEVVNSDMEREYYKFDKDNSELIVCKNCGELYEEEDVVNKFYIRNFGVDKNCFEEIILK